MNVREFIDEWNSTEDYISVKTSGSTGRPKEMKVQKERMRNSARITCDFLHLKTGDTALLCMSVDYIAGKMMVVRALERGMRLIETDPSNHPLRNIDTQIDFAAMIPSQVYETLKVPEEKEKLQKIRNLIIGGGAVSKQLCDEIRTFPNAIYSTYGMTETLSHIALRRLSGQNASEWYEPFESVKITQRYGSSVLLIDAPLVADGVLETNDIAIINEDGRRFKIIGRQDNVICSGGIKLQIEEIEEALRPHLPFPYAISKRRDEKFGEIAVLVVSQSSIGEETIIGILKSVLPKYSVPKVILHIDNIPLTETQKINRAELLRIINQ